MRPGRPRPPPRRRGQLLRCARVLLGCDPGLTADLADSTNAAVFIDFCRRLLHDAPGPVYLSLAGIPRIAPGSRKSSPSRPKAARSCSSCPAARPSSTQANGSGKMPGTTGSGAASRSGLTSRQDLKSKAADVLRRPRKRPGLVRAFIADPHASASAWLRPPTGKCCNPSSTCEEVVVIRIAVRDVRDTSPVTTEGSLSPSTTGAVLGRRESQVRAGGSAAQRSCLRRERRAARAED